MAGVKTFLSINSVGPESYFIRLADDKKFYAHLKSDSHTDDERQIEVEFKHGYKGAICFINDQADNFISLTGEAAKDLEKVKVTEIVPSDGSLN